MKVFITGGTGFVGSHIAEELMARGHELVALVRKAGSRPGAGEIVGDVTRPETFPPEKLAGCQAAIHLVGIIREFPGQEVTFRRVHVEGTRNVLNACRGAGIPRFLHMGTLGRGYRSRALFQKTRAHSENLVRHSGLDWTIFRPSTILGRGGELTRTLMSFIRMGVVPMPDAGRSLLAPVAVSTVAQGFANALERDSALGKVFELGGDTVSYRTLVEKMAFRMGYRPLYVDVPLGPLWAMASLLDTFTLFPITQEQIIMLQENALPHSDAAYQELGLEYKGIDRVLDEVMGEREEEE